jgi:peptidase E
MGKIILAGGGNAEQSHLVDEYFSELEPAMKMLFIPQAISPKQWSYDKALDWINKPNAFRNVSITMWRDINNKSIKDIKEFDSIYIMGGNTYELLYQLRSTGFLAIISESIKLGKTVYGISAGAYVLGRSVNERIPSNDENKNAVGLSNLDALDALSGYNAHCHYDSNHDRHLFDFEKKYCIPLIAIPETSGIVIENGFGKVVGYDPISVFNTNEKKTVYQPGQSFQLVS